MKLSKTNGNANTLAILSNGVEVSGDILFAEELQVSGKVAGKVTSDTGTLLIAETGRVEAQVDVGVCIIRGTVDGNVSARTRIEIYKSGRVRGDLITPVLLVEEGAVINGTIGMGKEAGSRLPEERPPDGDEERIRVKSA
jgi:cytoskeletal protein CcmA (bactofilin family)